VQTHLCTRSILRGTAMAVAALLLAACATPVGVERVDAKRVHRELTANAISTDAPSAASTQLLNRLDLAERFEKDPAGTLAVLHDGLAPTGDERRVFALAELSFLHGEKTGDRAQRLAAAIYAYAFLFPGDAGSAPHPLDPRLQVARNIYNRGLTLALESPDRRLLLLASGVRPLPFGRIDVAFDTRELVWTAGYQLDDLVPMAEFAVRGMRNRYRMPGIGAPLAAKLVPTPGAAPTAGAELIPERLRVPVTLFLRIDDARRHLSDGELQGRFELYSPDARAKLEVEGRPVPLELETTAPLAYQLEGAEVWDFEFAGFRSGDFLPGGLKNQLILLRPHRPGRIPVVLVHGTASSPARWAEMVNEFGNDPTIESRYEVWLFIYNTGNPVAMSGGQLVQALKTVAAQLDPAGTDAAMKKMVVIGHSQGGLLTKLTSVDSGTQFWDYVSPRPIGELKLSEESRTLLQKSMFYEPLPFVRRVVFIATPHRGSYLAAYSLSRLVTRLVSAPLRLTKLSVDLITQSQDELLTRKLERMPTSLDNMTPGNPFLQTLSTLPIDPRITAHSIVAVQGDGPPEEGGDGVVKYSSAHIDGVESELIVRSSHSTQANPNTINEVKRILIENATQP
jgi:pimeloyl-ACP methyl ester carboxylesterase